MVKFLQLTHCNRELQQPMQTLKWISVKLKMTKFQRSISTKAEWRGTKTKNQQMIVICQIRNKYRQKSKQTTKINSRSSRYEHCSIIRNCIAIIKRGRPLPPNSFDFTYILQLVFVVAIMLIYPKNPHKIRCGLRIQFVCRIIKHIKGACALE